jgi:O-antigen ligase
MKWCHSSFRNNSSLYIDTLSALLTLSVIAGLFFNGTRFEFYALTYLFLILSFTAVLMKGYSKGIDLPKNHLTALTTAFLIWLAITVTWSLVPYVSAVNFWILGTFPLVFWCFTLSNNQEELWRKTSILMLFLGLILSAVAIVQFLVFQEEPRATFLTRTLLGAFLNVILIVLSARYILLESKKESQNHALFWSGCEIFFLTFTLGIIRSRGALLGFGVGMSVLLFSAIKMQSRKTRIVYLIVLIACALLSANIGTSGEMVTRLAALQNPYSASSGRLDIWQGSWSMLQEAPWLGIGIGTYWLAWPPYHPFQDLSGGFFVHNDYLQIWIEAGLPALILLFMIMLAVLAMLIQFLRNNNIEYRHKIEMTGLFGALLAVSVHSFFDFNLYMVPTMILTGLILGRYHHLYYRHFTVNRPVWKIALDRWIRPSVFKSVLFVGLVAFSTHFGALGVSKYNLDRALEFVAKGDLRKANDYLIRAESLWRSVDTPRIYHAAILQGLLRERKTETNAANRKGLFQTAFAYLGEAERLNPLRPQIYVIRGLLYMENPEFAQENSREVAAQSFQKALALDPRYYYARIFYSQLLMKQSNEQEAVRILEEGIKHLYLETVEIIPYYQAVVYFRAKRGDMAGVKILDQKIQNIKTAFKESKKEMQGKDLLNRLILPSL